MKVELLAVCGILFTWVFAAGVVVLKSLLNKRRERYHYVEDTRDTRDMGLSEGKAFVAYDIANNSILVGKILGEDRQITGENNRQPRG